LYANFPITVERDKGSVGGEDKLFVSMFRPLSCFHPFAIWTSVFQKKGTMSTNQEAIQNETRARQQAILLGRKIATLETELKDNQPLMNQLKLLSANLANSREFLLSKDHPIAFIGSVGVGKTTAICGILGLVDERGGTVLSTSSGRTTLCEVEIRKGDKTRILISPSSPEDTRNYIRDFVDELRMRHDDMADDETQKVSMSEEVKRCVRNMMGLPPRSWVKAPDGTSACKDEALELYKTLGNPTAFLDEALKRFNLEDRVLTALEFDGENETSWIKEEFAKVNIGKHPKTPMPKRIVIELGRPLIDEPALNISLIDTKGLDGNVEREDIDGQFLNNRTICVVCSKFNDAPEQAVQDLLKHLLESGVSPHKVAEQTQLLVLERNEEAANVLSEEGPVSSEDEGHLVRTNQIQDTLRTRLKLSDQHFPQIHFLDAKKRDANSIQQSLVQMVLRLRKRRVDQINEIEAAVREISENREKAQAKAAFAQVSRSIQSWATASRQKHAEIHHIYKALVDDMTTKEVYATSIRAAVNRHGNWVNFDFYYKLAVAARKKSVTSFGDAVGEILSVLENFSRQQELKAAHPFIQQLSLAVSERMEHLYEAAASNGRNAYEDKLKADSPFWGCQQSEWGQGPGYKGRIAQGTEGWFSRHSPTSMDAQIQWQVMKEWNELIATVESLLENGSGA